MILNSVIWNVNPVAFTIPLPHISIPYWVVLLLFFLIASIRVFFLYRDYKLFWKIEGTKKHPKKFQLDIGDFSMWFFAFLIILILKSLFPLELEGPVQVRWYGIFWCLGFVLGYFIMQKIYRKEQMPDGALDKLLIYMLVFTIVGARLGHCLFYEPDYYLSNPAKMLAVWEG